MTAAERSVPPDGGASIPFHALNTGAVMERLGARGTGLTHADAQARLRAFGPNRLPPAKKRSPVLRFLAQFNNVVIHVLLAAAVITALIGHWIDSGVILGVVMVNALIGFFQEGKAERAMDAVHDMLSQQATVIRAGERLLIPADQLVPGDVIALQTGDRVPADARLLTARELRVDEAMLTGESVPAHKSPEPVAGVAVIGDRRNMVYSGTLVTTGRATSVVVATGQHTELGRISSLLSHVKPLTTPLLRQLDAFGRWLTAAILALSGLSFLFGVLLRAYEPGYMFMVAVGLAVAAIPEGLPAIITITLAIGVQRMGRRNAIIRRLPAVETLGSVTVICSDKTGTLTRNEMMVQSIALAGCPRPVTVSGAGYRPEGGFFLDGWSADAAAIPGLIPLCRAAMLCNDSAVRRQDGDWCAEGDPTEAALLVLGTKAGLDAAALLRECPRTDAIPFESEHRFMATLHHDHQGRAYIFAKGAPEAILPRCAGESRGPSAAPLDAGTWHALVESMGDEGQRPLAIAFRVCGVEQGALRFDDVQGLALLGVVGISDPPRPEAIASLQLCRSAGVQAKMITGDHLRTARAIAGQMGFPAGAPAVRGSDLDRIDDDRLAEVAGEATVFARTSPEHKLRLVRALQARGHVVAMTGDGVNDAPALKRADVGIAMGVKGTEAAREAAEVVLADDNFASIVHAIEEGRTVFDNIRKSILFMLPTNGGEALTILAALALGVLLPVTPVQILWVNMITTVTLALALAFEPAERNIMARPPRDAGLPILSGFMVWRIVFVSMLMVAATLGLFLLETARGTDTATARTVAVNTLVVCEALYLVNTRHLYATALTREGLLGSRYVVAAILLVLGFQVAFTYAPFMQQLFDTRGIDVEAWLRVAGAGLALFLLVEVEKLIVARRAVPNTEYRIPYTGPEIGN